MAESGRSRFLAPAPSFLMRPLAGLMEMLPSPPLTRDQILMLGVDNVASADGLAALGIEATPIEAEAPGYLVRYRDGGQYTQYRVK